MESLYIWANLFLISICIYSCKKDLILVCEPDPRLAALKTYAMVDSGFFTGTPPDTITYDLIVRLDTLTGDQSF